MRRIVSPRLNIALAKAYGEPLFYLPKLRDLILLACRSVPVLMTQTEGLPVSYPRLHYLRRHCGPAGRTLLDDQRVESAIDQVGNFERTGGGSVS